MTGPHPKVTHPTPEQPKTNVKILAPPVRELTARQLKKRNEEIARYTNIMNWPLMSEKDIKKNIKKAKDIF